MQLPRIAITQVPVPTPNAPDSTEPDVTTTLVTGLRLPRIPGLPTSDTRVPSLDDFPAPPSPDSVAGRADLAAVQAAQLLRTPAGDAWAQRMATDGRLQVFRDLLRAHPADTAGRSATIDAALIGATRAATAFVTWRLKQHFHRPRPFEVDPSIQPPVARPTDPSYPSGHTSSAFAAARLIARMVPALAGEAYNLATQVATSRVYAGVHYPTDVVAGALIGTYMGDRAADLFRQGIAPTQDALRAVLVAA